MIINKAFILILSAFLLLACGDDDQGSQNLIDQLGVVDVRIDLTDPDNQDLVQTPGFKYIDAGRRGIIVIRRNFNEFTAFERNCTFQPNGDCATVSMHPSFQFMLDSCCSSQFDLNGQILQPPASDPLVKYSTFLIGNELRIQFP